MKGQGRGGRVADASLPEETRSARSADPTKRQLLADGSESRPYQRQPCRDVAPTLPGDECRALKTPRAKSGLPKPVRRGIQSNRHMLNLSASQAAKKAFAELLEAIAAALDLTMGQSQFLLTLSGALLVFFVFYHLRRYVRAAPELPAEATFQAPGAPKTSRRRLYAVLGLVAGVLCLVIGYTFGSYDSSLPALGWLLIPTSLLAMGIISLLDSRQIKDGAAESSTEAPPDPLGTYAAISLVSGIFILCLGLACLEHARKAERRRAAEAPTASKRPRPFVVQPPSGANDQGSQKEMSDQDLARSLDLWRKKSRQATSNNQPSEGPAKTPEAPAPRAK